MGSKESREQERLTEVGARARGDISTSRARKPRSMSVSSESSISSACQRRFLAGSFYLGLPRWAAAGSESSEIDQASGGERIALVGARHNIREEMLFPQVSA